MDENVISQANHEIRNFINDSIIKKTNILLSKNDGYWNQLFSALDTTEDTSIAITDFIKAPADFFAVNPYVITYGLLQALYLQQDAVNHLKISLFGNTERINWQTTYPGLNEIRQLRNETIGHPTRTTNNGRKSNYTNDEISTCTIDRSSLSKDGFSYMLWMHSKTEKKNINFLDTIKLQDKYLGQELRSILEKMRKEEKEHKSKFANEKLANLLTDQGFYQIHLIYGVAWNDHLAWPSFDHYFEQYKTVREGLESRYGKLGFAIRIPGTELVIKKLDHILSKLETFKTTSFNEQEFEIYVDALDAGRKELRGHLEEIDKEFE